jgi:hypothetical protein
MPFTGQLATASSTLGNVELGGPVPNTPVPPYPKVMFEINFTDNPTVEFPPTGYTDISNRVRAFSTRRGRSNFVDRVEAGTATVELDNRDGYLNFTQTGRLLMRRARLSVIYDQTVYRLLTGHIDSYRYSYPGVDKDAVCELTISDGLKVLAQQVFPANYQRENESTSARVANVLTTGGIGSSYQSIVGSVSVNEVAPVSFTGLETTQTKAATLTNLSAMVTVASTAGLKPGMTVTGPGVPQGTTIQAVTSSTTFTMTQLAFLARAKTCSGRPQSNVLNDLNDAQELSVGMTVGPYNNSNSQAIFQAGTVITEVGTSSVTITPATNNVTFWDGASPAGYINACPFNAGASPTLTLPRQYLQVSGVLDHVRQLEATERGTFLCLGDGSYQYQGSGYRPAQTVQLTFGENTGAGEVPYRESPIAMDDVLISNDYRLTNTYTGTVVAITDATSQANYFRHSQQIDQVWYLDSSLALPTAERAFQPIPRMEGLIVNPAADPLNLWAKTLTLEVSKRVSLRRRPAGGADIFATYDQFVEGIEHDATPAGWQLTFVTSPYRA